MVQHAAEGTLIGGVLIDVWNAELGFPQKGMVCPSEDLALFGDGMNDRLQRGAAIGDAEPIGFDFFDNLPDSPPDGAKILEPLIP